MFEAADAARVRAARRPGAKPYAGAFAGEWPLRNPRNAREPGAETVPRETLRRSDWANALNGQRLVSWVREEVFPFHAGIAAEGVTDFMADARLVIDEPTVLSQVVSHVNDLHLEQVDADTKGDLFEHVLRQIRQAGELGQFRTPRHVIRAMVQLVEPRLGETVHDPAAGTAGFLVGAYDHIRLANPPFSGRLDPDRIVDDVKIGRTRQTELLFLQYILNHLKDGGRCGVVVPEGVLFGSTGAHRELRRKLVENNRMDAVLSLPGGVFNPYSGVKTSVLVFRKGGRTDRVMFLHADNDGFKLDANHDTPIDADDLPGLVSAFRDREARWKAWTSRDPATDWTEKWWFAEADAIREADFNLSAGRYRPQSRTKVDHRDPLEILNELKAIENEILGDGRLGRGSTGGRGAMTSRIVPLGELCEMDRRGLRPDDPAAAGLPLLGVENVGSGTGALNLDAGSRVGVGKSTSFRFDERHVLYAKLRPYLNKVATPEFAGRCSTELVPLLARSGVDREYLAHLLRRKETVSFVMSSVT